MGGRYRVRGFVVVVGELRCGIGLYFRGRMDDGDVPRGSEYLGAVANHRRAIN